MKQVRVILITVELAALACVAFFAFADFEDEEMQLFKSLYITGFSILAVVLQREQQDLASDEEEETMSEEDGRIEMYISSEMDKGR